MIEGVNLKKIFKVYNLVLLIILTCFLIGCGSPAVNTAKMGNTNANIVTGGTSVKSDDWIYFVNYADSNFLYKIKTDGTGETKISDDAAFCLNFYKDWLYYVNSSDNNKIYKIKTDGSERTVVSDISSANLLVYDDWIYFINNTFEESSDDYNKVFRIKTDGTGKEKINNDKTSMFNIVGDNLYYVEQNEQKMYRIKTDGSDKTKIIDAKISFFNVVGNNIFYLDAEDENNNIMKMNIDGTGTVKLSEDKAAPFNVSGDWIYYGNTIKDSPDMELKRMKLDGTGAAVINDDNAMVINVHDDWLVYIGINFNDFSIKQTIIKEDGSGRKDYLYTQTPQAQNAERYPMKETVSIGDISVTVNSAYSTNIVKYDQPGYDSQIFDYVTDGVYLYINTTIANEGIKEIDLMQMTGIIEDIEAMGLNVTWGPMADITDEPGKDNISFHLANDRYMESIMIESGEAKDLQLYYELYYGLDKTLYPVYLGIFDGINTNPLAIFEVFPDDEYYVTSYESAVEIMNERFPEYEITMLQGVGHKFEGEDIEKMYYLFETKKKGASETEYFLVKRDTGEIFNGKYDQRFPDYPAVPVSLLE